MDIKYKRVIFRYLTAFFLLYLSGCSGVRAVDALSCDPASGMNSSANYHLQSGDEVELQVYREPQLSGVFRIDAAGLIRHPLCGSFKAAGLTPTEVEARLIELLGEKYLVNPKVIATISSAQNSHVVILGEVEDPGVHSISFGESITLLQAIAEAGGFTDLASVNRVSVTRTVDGKEQSIRVRVSKMISGQEPDLPLEPNDIIMVPQIVF